jgi:hypothetical protein
VDAVRTMAAAIWRKQNLGIFQRAAEARPNATLRKFAWWENWIE